MRVGDELVVRVEKITIGKDNKVYVSVSHRDFLNRPTFYTTNINVALEGADRKPRL